MAVAVAVAVGAAAMAAQALAPKLTVVVVDCHVQCQSRDRHDRHDRHDELASAPPLPQPHADVCHCRALLG